MDANIEVLIPRVRALMGDWPQLAKEADVSYSWLCKFAQGHIQNPTYKHINRLSAAVQAREQRTAA